jgi:choline dehydrogenase-like flavoprotein
MSTRGPYDVIIVGSGAGGGTLAPTGKRILLLERGGWLPGELDNWDAEAAHEPRIQQLHHDLGVQVA